MRHRAREYENEVIVRRKYIIHVAVYGEIAYSTMLKVTDKRSVERILCRDRDEVSRSADLSGFRDKPSKNDDRRHHLSKTASQ